MQPTMRLALLLLLLLPFFLPPPSFFFCRSLPDSEKAALVQLKEILENPAALSDWGWQTDFCNLQPTAEVKVLCEAGGGDGGGRVIHLQIAGDRAASPTTPPSGGSRQPGMLSERFSSETLILHLTNFTSLKVLELTSLGLWGPLPSKLGRLQYLETLDLSFNFFSGVIPNRLTSLRRLRRLSLDSNSVDGSLPPRWTAVASLSSVSLSNNRLHGSIPPSIFSDVPSLSVLILDNNSFSGSLPSSLASATQLQFLSASGNRLSGELPDLFGLYSLQALDLHGNKLGPAFPSLPPQLLSVSLSCNQFRGPLPASVASLAQLRQLDLSYNLFSGVAPPVLFCLPRLVRLDLARNRLTGTLSPNLTLSRRLTELDFSFNLISGPLPPAVEAILSDGGDRVRFQWNCLSTKLQPQNPFSYCQNAALASGLDMGHVASAESLRRRRSGGSGGAALVAGIVVAVLLGFVAVTLLLLFGIVRWQQRRRNASEEGGESGDDGGRKLAAGWGGVDHKSVFVSSEIFSSARYISRTRKLAGLGWPQFRVYAPEEIYKATCRFDDSMLIGDGGHGKVYKGVLEDGTAIAVKVLREEEEEEEEDLVVVGGRLKVLKAHVEHLGKFRHKHLVALLGYAIIVQDEEEADDDEEDGLQKKQLDGGGCRMYLVYEYVDGTTLRAKLAGSSSAPSSNEAFGWLHRLQAIIGAAKALHFLHCGLVPGVFDNNVTSNNVLLDCNSVSKLSDFGLSIRRDIDDAQHNNNNNNNSNSMRNFLQHANAEKNRKEGGGGDKTDVYNFGLILLEALIGKVPCIQALESLLFAEHEPRRLDAIIDPLVLGTCDNAESLQTVVDITVKCLCKDPKGRPSMEDVLWNLQYAYQVLLQNSSAGAAAAGDHSVDDEEDGVLLVDDHHPKAVLLLAGGKRRRKTVAGGGGGSSRRSSCRIEKMSSNDEVAKPSSPNTEFLR